MQRSATECAQPRAESYVERSRRGNVLEHAAEVNSRRKQVGGHNVRHIFILDLRGLVGHLDLAPQPSCRRDTGYDFLHVINLSQILDRLLSMGTRRQETTPPAHSIHFGCDLNSGLLVRHLVIAACSDLVSSWTTVRTATIFDSRAKTY